MRSMELDQEEGNRLEHVEEALRGARERLEQFDPDAEKARYKAVKADYNHLTGDEEETIRERIRETDYSYPQTTQLFDDCDQSNREYGRALSFLYHANVIGKRFEGVGPTRWDLRSVEEDTERFEEMFDAVVDEENRDYIFQDG